MLDLLADCTECYAYRDASNYTLFAQPGMRNHSVIGSLRQDKYSTTRPEREKADSQIKFSIMDVKGRMHEDIVLPEMRKACSHGREAFQFKFAAGNEYDATKMAAIALFTRSGAAIRSSSLNADLERLQVNM